MPSKEPAVKISAVNNVIARLAGMDRDAAVKILVAHGAATVKTSTSQLKPERYRAVIDDAERELAKLDVPPAPEASPGLLHEFNVEGHPIQCHESDGHRLWHCDCAYFQRTMAIYNEGFCPHVVVAIGLALRDGTMDLGRANKPTNTRAG